MLPFCFPYTPFSAHLHFRSPSTVLLPHSALFLLSFYPILLPSIPLPLSFYCPSTPFCSPLILFRSPSTVLLPHSAPLYSTSALLLLSFYHILLPSIPLPLSFYYPSTPFYSPLFLFRSPSTVLLPHSAPPLFLFRYPPTVLLPHSAPLYSSSALLLLSFYPHSAPLYSSSALLLLSFYPILLPSIPLPLSFYCPSTPFCSPLFLFRSPSTVLLPHSAPIYSSSALLLLSFYPILLPSIPLPLSSYCPSTHFCSPLFLFCTSPLPLSLILLPFIPFLSRIATFFVFLLLFLLHISISLSSYCHSSPFCSPIFLFGLRIATFLFSL